MENKYEICYYKLKGLDKIIKNFKPDIVVVHNKHVLNFFLNNKLIKLKEDLRFKLYYRTIPYIIPNKATPLYKSYKGNNIFKRLILRSRVIDFFIFGYYNFVFNKIDHFLTYIPTGKQIISSYGIKNNKVTTVYNTPDTLELDKIEKKIKKKIKKKYDIIYVGSLNKWKKVDLLIKSIILLKQYNIKALIVGDGNLKNKINEKIKKEKLENTITVTGSIYNKKKLYYLFKQSKIFVLPGPGGLAINEAMHAGLPIICSQADGTEKTLVKNNFNGFFFKKDDHSDLCKKINSLTNDNKRIRRMGLNSKKIIKEKINSFKINKKYEKAFKK